MTAADRDREAFKAWEWRTISEHGASQWTPGRAPASAGENVEERHSHARAQAGEPVAWRFRWHFDGQKAPSSWMLTDTAAAPRDYLEVEPLYTHPAPAQEPVAVPAGFVLVPVGPTREMLDAGVAAVEPDYGMFAVGEGDAAAIWAAMLSASTTAEKRGAACAMTDGVKEALASTPAPQPGSEPKGCPTPGACSCQQPGGAAKVKALTADQLRKAYDDAADAATEYIQRIGSYGCDEMAYNVRLAIQDRGVAAIAALSPSIWDAGADVVGYQSAVRLGNGNWTEWQFHRERPEWTDDQDVRVRPVFVPRPIQPAGED